MVPKEGGELSKPSEDPFHAMLGKALVDLEYRGRLLNPETRADALKEIGVADPNEEQLQAVENAKTALQSLYGSFGEGVGAA
jgi:hypothetical protein